MGVQSLDYARSVVRVGPRLSKLALLSPCFPTGALFLLFLSRRSPLREWLRTLPVPTVWWTIDSLLVLGVIVGLVSAIRCDRSEGRLKGAPLAQAAFISSAFVCLPAALITLFAHTFRWASPG